MKQLVNGKIPAGTECPWYKTCGTQRADKCYFAGRLSVQDYSCGLARAFALTERNHQAQNNCVGACNNPSNVR